VNEGLEADIRNRLANSADIFERILTRKHHALDPKALHHGGARCIVDRHLGGSVNLEAGVNGLDQPHDPDVLYYRCVDPPVYGLAEKVKSIGQLPGFDEGVEREVYANSPGVRQATRSLELVEGKLRTFIARIEPFGAEVYGIGPVRDRCANGVDRACR
jgi:hypothetical protein